MNFSFQKKIPKNYEISPLKIVPLGGCGEFGMNLTCYMCQGHLLIVDCGIMFAEPHCLGISGLIPDPLFLKRKDYKSVSYIITHGHEDHIGALPHFYRALRAPIYATPWTCGLIKNKFDKIRLPTPDLHRVMQGQKLRIGPFSVEYVHVNHSIPDACALVIEADGKKVFHTGDFKIDDDYTMSPAMDFAYLKKIGDRGIDIMFSDSTNSHKKGMGPSEQKVIPVLEKIIMDSKKRVYFTTFASNFWRLLSLATVCKKLKRPLVVIGRGVRDSYSLAESLGYFRRHEGMCFDTELRGKPDPRGVFLISGSQGEERSALSRIVYGESDRFQMSPGDVVVFSARVIPGNETSIATLMDRIRKLGAQIITSKEEPYVHVSGHAFGGELQKLTEAIRPKIFIPVHGSFSHMRSNYFVGKETLKNHEAAMIDDGDVCEYFQGKLEIHRQAMVPGWTYVDDHAVLPLAPRVARERLHIGEHGLVSFSALLNRERDGWIGRPEIKIKGLEFYGSPVGLNQILSEIHLCLHRFFKEKPEIKDTKELELWLSKNVEKIFFRFLKKKPTVLVKLWLTSGKPRAKREHRQVQKHLPAPARSLR